MSSLFIKRLATDWIVCHCTATPPHVDVGVKEVRQWHRAQGWADIGYHFVIRRNGEIEVGRPQDVVGSHVKGFNSYSVAFSLVGGVNDKMEPEENFTPVQYEAMAKLLDKLTAEYPGAVLRGHRDFPNVHKACPSFDFPKWVKEVYHAQKAPVSDHASRNITITNDVPTFSAAARKFGFTVAAVLAVNPGIDPRHLKVGQVIKLPN